VLFIGTTPIHIHIRIYICIYQIWIFTWKSALWSTHLSKPCIHCAEPYTYSNELCIHSKTLWVPLPASSRQSLTVFCVGCSCVRGGGQAIFSKHKLKMGAYLSRFVTFLTYVVWPIAYPLARLLDRVLGKVKKIFSKKRRHVCGVLPTRMRCVAYTYAVCFYTYAACRLTSCQTPLLCPWQRLKKRKKTSTWWCVACGLPSCNPPFLCPWQGKNKQRKKNLRSSCVAYGPSSC